jgi:cytochrome c
VLFTRVIDMKDKRRALMQVVGVITMVIWMAGDVVAQGDPERGADVFKKCAQCHSLKPGETIVGPSLKGVIGRRAGTLEGYSFSNAMIKHAVAWDAGTLDVYLTKPSKVVPGTKMGFAGLPNPNDRANLVAYLLKAAQ